MKRRIHSAGRSDAPTTAPPSADAWALPRGHIATGALVAAVVTGFVAVLSLSVPLFDNIAYHRVLESKSEETLLLAAILCAAGMIGYAILDYVRGAVAVVVANRLMRDLTLPCLHSALADPKGNASLLAAQAVKDLGSLRNFAMGTACLSVFDLLWSPLFIVILWLMHPLLGWYMVGNVLVLVGLGAMREVCRARPRKRHPGVGAPTVIGSIGLVLRNAEVIDGMGLAPALTRRWEEQTRHELREQGLADQAGRAMSIVSTVLVQSSHIGLGCLSAYLIINNEVPAIALIVTNLLSRYALAPYNALIRNILAWNGAIAATGQLRDLVRSPIASPDQQSPALVAGSGQERPRLAVRGMTYHPPGAAIPILTDVSFDLGSGDVLGIVGSSGAGKTTLARLLAGAIAPTQGCVLVDGRELSRLPAEERNHLIGFVPQDVQLLDATIMQNIARFSDDEQAALEAARIAGMHDIVGRLPKGYDTMVGDEAFAVSGGQRQRIALARAIFRHPALLILDEPNSNLDFDGEKALIAAIHHASDRGAAVVVISHRQTLLSAMTRIMVLEQGRIVQTSPDSEMSDPASAHGPAYQPTGTPPVSSITRLRPI